MADLLFLMDLCLLLLSAYYTDRTANAIVASQTASVEAGQHSQTCEMHQQAGFDRKLSKVSLAEAGVVSKKELAARTMSRSKSKRDMVFMPGPTAGGMNMQSEPPPTPACFQDKIMIYVLVTQSAKLHCVL